MKQPNQASRRTLPSRIVLNARSPVIAERLETMKRFWPFWVFPVLQFTLLVASMGAAWHADSIFGGASTGDLALWKSGAQLVNRMARVTALILPVMLVVILIRSQEKRALIIPFVCATICIVGALRFLGAAVSL